MFSNSALIIQEQYRRFKEKKQSYALVLDKNNIYKMKGSMSGPIGTSYQGGIFYFEITFPQNYPLQKPEVCFTTKIYHMNIGENGKVCFGNFDWNKDSSFCAVLNSIVLLLNNPYPNSTMRGDLKKLYESDKNKYFQIAKEETQKYAKP